MSPTSLPSSSNRCLASFFVGECNTILSLNATCFNGLSRVGFDVVDDDDDVNTSFDDAFGDADVSGDDERLRCRSRSDVGTGGGLISPESLVAAVDAADAFDVASIDAGLCVNEMQTSPILSWK